MQLFLVVTSVLSLLTITVGRVVTGRLPLHQNVHIGDRATPSLMHEVIISIKLKQLDKLKAFVDDVSSPMSPNYGNHMTRTELAERYSNYEGLESVKSYFEKKMFVITKSSKYGEFIHVKGTITQWEDVLETKFYEMHQVKDMSSFNLGHTGSRKQRTETLLRAKEYTIPQEIQHHVQAMFNTIQIPPKFKKTAITSSVPIQPDAVVTPVPGTYLYDGYVTPQLLYQLYNITSNIGNSLTSQALYESLEEDYSPSDLTGFQNQFKLLVQPIEGDYGGYNSSDYCINPPLGGGCGEANLDVQYIMAVAQNIPTYYYYDNSTDFLITWAFNILNMENPPLVTSISYSGYESDFSQEYLDVFEALAITLSSIGVTIVASSGDDGVAGYLARYNSTFCGYNPQFPVSSPYVLAVGATQGPESSNPEIACSSDTGGVITTGGGFSDFYPMPSYQYSAVRDGYLAGLKSLPTNSAPVAGYSSTGRGYPDISALGYEYLLLIGGNWTAESGTSASAPVVAGMIALVNAARRKAGKGNLGWVNPALYAYAANFSKDVVSGNNKCGAGHNISTIICCSEGFESTPGWDPVTGLGVIDFPKFLSTLATVKGVPVSAPTPNSSSDSSGLSGGAIAGIVIAVLAFLVGVVIAFLVVRRKSSISEPLIIESRENSKFGA